MTDTDGTISYRVRIIVPEESEQKTVTRARIVYAQPEQSAKDSAPRSFRVVYKP